jgi:hypothetical protein
MRPGDAGGAKPPASGTHPCVGTVGASLRRRPMLATHRRGSARGWRGNSDAVGQVRGGPSCRLSDAVRKSSTILSAFTRGSDASMIGTFARNEGGGSSSSSRKPRSGARWSPPSDFYDTHMRLWIARDGRLDLRPPLLRLDHPVAERRRCPVPEPLPGVFLHRSEHMLGILL